ncbi:hypothetical protein BN1058_00698 [Paraliobacillus sp. PM-2]|uniref:hypothetical protein n=1 Tax=Paraliobacillus sp. PM-2 TaxID=1462524 RepID=UPI00061C7C31|nr:hypothetical protein [Paraliobacillus sp. PM-2]CQR46438.1 hypothetical protein BN1058_00698 [Paraliobacillus sp. PM-2]
MSDNKRKSGRPREVSDEKLKEMALSIKHKYRGKKLSYKFLESETGIGRHTWKRRIGYYIDELNKPVILPSNETLEDVYLPNIEELFERHKNNKEKIVNELYHFEQMFRKLLQELSTLKKKVASLEELPDLVERQKEELKLVSKSAEHYESSYKNLVITSGFSHLREEKGIKDNLLEFHSKSNQHITLNDNEFKEMFSHVNKKSKEKSIQGLSKEFPNLFNDE